MMADSDVLKIEIANKQREYNNKLKAIARLKDTINSFNNNNNVKISEHAILRYLERVKGIDIPEIEKEILTDDVLSFVETLGGSGKYPIGNFQIVMKDYTITTVV